MELKIIYVPKLFKFFCSFRLAFIQLLKLQLNFQPRFVILPWRAFVFFLFSFSYGNIIIIIILKKKKKENPEYLLFSVLQLNV